MPDEIGNSEVTIKSALEALEDYSLDEHVVRSQNYRIMQAAVENKQVDTDILQRILAVCVHDSTTLKYTTTVINIISAILSEVKSGNYDPAPDLVPSAVAVMTMVQTIASLSKVDSLMTLACQTLFSYPEDTLIALVEHKEDLIEIFNLYCNLRVPRQTMLMALNVLHKLLKLLPPEQRGQFVEKGMSVWFSKIIPVVMLHLSPTIDVNSQNKMVIETLEMLTDEIVHFNYTDNPHWHNILECICNAKQYPAVLKNHLQINFFAWNRLWIVFIRLLKHQVTLSLGSVGTPINSLLPVVETAFKLDVTSRCKAFQCWNALIDSFSTETNENNIHKRIKLLIIPLKSNNAKAEETALAKFKCWWHLIWKFQSKMDKFLDSVLISFLHFCFGRHNVVDKSVVPGQISPCVKNQCNQAIVELVGHVNCSGCTDLPKLKQKLINTKHLVDNWNHWIYSLTSVIMKTTTNNGLTNQQLTCLWKSFLMTIGELPQNNIRKDLFEEVLSIVAHLLQGCKSSNQFLEITFNVIVMSLFDEDTKIKELFKSDQDSNNPIVKTLKIMLETPILHEYYARMPPTELLSRFKMFTKLIVDNKICTPRHITNSILLNLPINNYGLLFWSALTESMSDVKYEKCLVVLHKILLWPLTSINMFTEVKIAAMVWYNAYIELHPLLSKTDMDKEISEILLSASDTTISTVYFKLIVLLGVLKHKLTENNCKECEKEINLLLHLIKSIDNYDNFEQIFPMLVDRIVAIMNVVICNANETVAALILVCVKNVLHILTQSCEQQSDVSHHMMLIEHLLKPLCRLFEIESYSHLIPAMIYHLLVCSPLLASHSTTQGIMLPIMKIMLTKTKFADRNYNKIKSVIDDIENGKFKTEDIQPNSEINKFTTPQVKEVPKRTKKKEANIVNTVVENGEEYVVVKSNWKFNPRKLTENQKEKLQRKREDIPALYQDLSQSQDEFKLASWKTDSQDTTSSSKSESKSSKPGNEETASEILKNLPSTNVVPTILENFFSEKDKNDCAIKDSLPKDSNPSKVEVSTLSSTKNTKSPRIALKDRVFRNVRNLIENSGLQKENKDSSEDLNRTVNNVKTPTNTKTINSVNIVNSAPPLLSADRPSRVKRKPKKFEDLLILKSKKNRQSLNNVDSDKTTQCDEASTPISDINNKSTEVTEITQTNISPESCDVINMDVSPSNEYVQEDSHGDDIPTNKSIIGYEKDATNLNTDTAMIDDDDNEENPNEENPNDKNVIQRLVGEASDGVSQLPLDVWVSVKTSKDITSSNTPKLIENTPKLMLAKDVILPSNEVTTPKTSKPVKETSTPKTSKSAKEVSTPSTSKDVKDVSTPKTSKPIKEVFTASTSKDNKDVSTPKSSKLVKDVSTPSTTKLVKEVSIPSSSRDIIDASTPKTSKPVKELSTPSVSKDNKEVSTPKTSKFVKKASTPSMATDIKGAFKEAYTPSLTKDVAEVSIPKSSKTDKKIALANSDNIEDVSTPKTSKHSKEAQNIKEIEDVRTLQTPQNSLELIPNECITEISTDVNEVMKANISKDDKAMDNLKQSNDSKEISTPKLLPNADEQKSTAKKRTTKKSRIEKELAIDTVEGHPYLKIHTAKRLTRKTLESANSGRRKSLSVKLNKSKSELTNNLKNEKKNKERNKESENTPSTSVVVDESQDRDYEQKKQTSFSDELLYSDDVIESSQDSTITTISVKSTKKTPSKVPFVYVEKLTSPPNCNVNVSQSILDRVIVEVHKLPSGHNDTKDDTVLPLNKTVLEEKTAEDLTENMDTEPIDEKDISEDIITINYDVPVVTTTTNDIIVGPETQELAEADTQPTNPEQFMDIDKTQENIPETCDKAANDANNCVPVICDTEYAGQDLHKDKSIILKQNADNTVNNTTVTLSDSACAEIEQSDGISSPFKDVTQRQKDFLNNTIEISPIKTMSPDRNKKSPSPETSSDYVVITLSSPVQSNGEPFSKCGSPEVFTEDKVSPDKRDQSPPRVEISVTNTSPSSSLSLKKNRPQVRSGGRAAQMLGLCVPDKVQAIVNLERIDIEEIKKGNPTNTPARRNLRILYNSVSDNTESSNSASENDDNDHFLKFRRSLPAVDSSPSGPILKRKLAEITDDAMISPASKRKRVSFHDPPVSTTISVQKYIEPGVLRSPQNSAQKRLERQMRQHTPIKSAKRLDNVFKLDTVLTKTVESFSDNDIVPISDDTQQNSLDETPMVEIVRVSELNDTDPICPDLLDCKDSIENIAGELSSPAMKVLLIKEFKGKIESICDLAKMTELEVNRLCIKAPKVKVVNKVLKEYALKKFEKASIEMISTIDKAEFDEPMTESKAKSVDINTQTDTNVSIEMEVQTMTIPTKINSVQTESAPTTHSGVQTDESGNKTTKEIIKSCLSEKPDFVEQLSEQLEESSIEKLSERLPLSTITDLLMKRMTPSDTKTVLNKLHESNSLNDRSKELSFICEYLCDRFDCKDLVLLCSQMLKVAYDKPA